MRNFKIKQNGDGWDCSWLEPSGWGQDSPHCFHLNRKFIIAFLKEIGFSKMKELLNA